MKHVGLIGFTGEIGAGKDEAGAALTQLGYLRMAFGDAIKDMLSIGLGLTHEQLHGSQADKARKLEWLDEPNNSPRRMLQTLGTEWGRDTIDPALWVKVLSRRLYTMLPSERVVVTDIRFENEAQMIRDHGGLVVHLRRRRRTSWWSRLLSWVKPKHPSEQMPVLQGGDLLIYNDGTVEDLHRAVLAVAIEGLRWPIIMAKDLEDLRKIGG